MRRHTTALWSLLTLVPLAAPLGGQGWEAQRYEVSSRFEADAESVAHPRARTLALIVPEAVPNAEVCVGTGSVAHSPRGRIRVEVVISRQGGDGESVAIQDLEFAWRAADPPRAERCRAVRPLEAGDLVEFRFRFRDMEPLRLRRDGQRIEVLPRMWVTGLVQLEPFRG